MEQLKKLKLISGGIIKSFNHTTYKAILISCPCPFKE